MGLLINYYLQWDEKSKKPIEDLQSQVPKIQRELKELLAAYQKRQKYLLEKLHQQGYCCRYATAYTASRVVTGLGNPNPIENGLTFHYPLGFPVIPASSQKGISSNYAALFKEKDRSNNDSDALNIFGSPAEQEKGRGKVLFFNAFPTYHNNRILEADIMTPHYEPYYTNEGGKPPADYYSPIPIGFFTIAAHVSFFFSMAALSEGDLCIAWSWLKNALYEMGIGGKTNLGYGRFNKDGFDKYEVTK
jgi:CRISPR-associated protein Cmr6